MTDSNAPDPAATAAEPWFVRAFGPGYLELYSHRNLEEAQQAVRFLAHALALKPTHTLLDLCCGPGRHLADLGQCVGRAIGLDLARLLLHRAGEHWGDVHSTAPDLIQADMRRPPFGDERFDRVVNLFTSFGYFADENDNEAVLREIARILRSPSSKRNPDGGLLAIDHINREALLANFNPQTERTLPGGQRMVERRRWDDRTRRVHKDVECRMEEGWIRTWHESVRVYEADELEGMLAEAGLEPIARHGDYDGAPWDADSPRLILIARKSVLRLQRPVLRTSTRN